MRLHRVEMTAFGPYAGTEVLDFEPLNDAGLFLLTGPTGAGKTTILDAVCFALYGVVPGERGTRALRSDHAPVDRRPQVVLEATIGDRRYRIRRSPEWRRPKRRGVGETKEHACASLLEIGPDGQERLLTSRIAEVGHELQLVLGMSSEQFLQVVLLPQGGFQTFLHASSDERQAVLQKLFHTHRFARIEEWLRDRTRDARGRCDSAERLVTQQLATLAHRSGVSLPEELAGERLGDVAANAAHWARGQLEAASAAHTSALARHEQALTEEAAARAAAAEAARRRGAAAEAAAARQVLERLAATAAEAASAEHRLSEHERARSVAPLLAGLPELERRNAAAAARSAQLVSAVERRLAALPAGTTHATDWPGQDRDHDHDHDHDKGRDNDGCRDGDLRTLLLKVRSGLDGRLGRLRALLPREAEHRSLQAERARVASRLDRARQRADEVAGRAAALPERRDRLVAEVAELRPRAAGIDEARANRDAAAARERSAAASPAARAVRDRLRRAWTETREAAADAREQHLTVVERRLAGMAAELAGQLAAGDPCQVCGSPDHPRPAAALPHAVSEAQQADALGRYDRARQEAERAEDAYRDADRELQELEAGAAGADADAAARVLAACEERLAEAATAAQLLPVAVARLGALLEEETGLAEEGRQAASTCRELEAALVAIETRLATTADELAEALGGDSPTAAHDGSGLAPLLRSLEEAAAAVSSAVAALDERADLARRIEDVQAQAAVAARQHGFCSPSTAVAAVLADDVAVELGEGLRARDDQRRAAETTLARHAGHQDLDLDVGEEERSRTALAAAERRSAERAAAVGAAGERQHATRQLVDALDRALASWEPLRADRAVTESLSGLVRGMSADNQLQMRLSSYVLATRLDQVLAAANERLSVMRDQRYTVRRCGRRTSTGRAGLGLEVLDAWTDEARPPSTLSGGETFVVSLALALGLADVVAEESGGLSVGTLFVDEGFGMLDPDTLDDVMDRIDSLRAGGRTVGVVSHVTELRARIPTQVHVTPTREGSTVEVRAPDLAPA